MMIKKLKYGGLVLAGGILLMTASCRKWLPADLDYLSQKATYTQTEFNPILGRTTLYSLIFNTDNSNTPINFKITNVRYRLSGKPTNDLDKEVQVLVWKEAYTGYEKSVAEINAKRTTETHPIWEIRPTSGDFILWASADSTMLHQQPDSGYLFDVIASNSGGTNTYQNLVLDPLREEPYEPYDRDQVTGERLKTYPNPLDSSRFIYRYIHPSISNIVGDSTDLPMRSDSVRVLFHKTGSGNSLTFKFLDKDSMLINPARFNDTRWDSLVHGFNVKVTDTAVRYDVAYPIPVVKYRTRFTTSDGSEAAVKFTYDRIGYGNIREKCSVSFNFAIYQKGDWDVIFYFYSDNPKFRNE
jgi:hypothetical protein